VQEKSYVGPGERSSYKFRQQKQLIIMNPDEIAGLYQILKFSGKKVIGS
jgi:hypothetical protein